MLGAHDDDSLSSLAGRLARLNKQLTPEEERRLTKKMDGTPLTQIVHDLLQAMDPDAVEAAARARSRVL